MATDLYGARLPDGVVARLGTARPSLVGERVSALAFAPDSQMLASGGEDGSVRLWDVGTAREVCRLGDHAREVGALAFAPGGATLVSGGHDGTVALWDVKTGREQGLIQAPAGLRAFYFVDAHMLLAACTDETYRAWDLATGTEVARDPTRLGSLQALCFFPDGQLVGTGSWESTVRVCDLATGQERRQFQGHRGSLQAVAVSPDGRTLASGAMDETIRLWEVQTVKERLQFPGQKEGVFALAFSPDSRTLASASNDSTILIWDVTCWGQTRALARQPAGLLPSQLELLWQELASADVSTAYRAIWGVATAAKQTIPFLKNRLAQLVPVDRQRISTLVADLNHPLGARRDKAAQELEKAGALCEPMLRTALQNPPSMDVRRRLEKLLEKTQGPVPSPSTLHALRVVEALERAHTPEARQILEKLSGEAPPTRVTQEAKASLERLAKWPPGPA